MAALRVNVVKDVKPLRYRIAPIEEKVDALEKLEAEFNQAVKAGKIPEEVIEEYSTYLKVQRDKIHAVKCKALGIKPEVEKELVDFSYIEPRKDWRYYWHEYCFTDTGFKVALALFVLCWIYSINH